MSTCSTREAVTKRPLGKPSPPRGSAPRSPSSLCEESGVRHQRKKSSFLPSEPSSYNDWERTSVRAAGEPRARAGWSPAEAQPDAWCAPGREWPAQSDRALQAAHCRLPGVRRCERHTLQRRRRSESSGVGKDRGESSRDHLRRARGPASQPRLPG